MNDGAIKVGKRTYTFHLGPRPTAKLTEWTIAEYISQFLAKTQKGSILLCCLYSPKNQYAMDTTSDRKRHVELFKRGTNGNDWCKYCPAVCFADFFAAVVGVDCAPGRHSSNARVQEKDRNKTNVVH